MVDVWYLYCRSLLALLCAWRLPANAAFYAPDPWHRFAYAPCRNGDGTYGPPGYDKACDMAQRMIAIANFRLMPARFQLFLQECRNTPS